VEHLLFHHGEDAMGNLRVAGLVERIEGVEVERNRGVLELDRVLQAALDCADGGTFELFEQGVAE
jgi:hypothetical protein